METLPLSPKDFGKRLDKVFHNYYSTLSRNEIARCIREGNITLRKKVVKPSYILKKDDIITFSKNILEKPEFSLKENPTIHIPILFENTQFLIINKPAGIQVHPSSSEGEKTVAHWLVTKFPTIRNVGEDSARPGIVHRLDKDTSGIMIIAKTQKSFKYLKKIFQNREIQKTYLAFVYGSPKPKEGEITFPIARSKSFRKQVIVRENTTYKGEKRDALTYYTIQNQYQDIQGNTYSLLQVSPKTGRMHQIRVHLSSIGHPIIGDTLYKRKDYPTPPGVKRFLLHAHTLSFTLFGKHYIFTAPLPKDMQTFSQKCTS